MQTFVLEEFATRNGIDLTQLNKALDWLPDAQENGPWLAGGALRRTLDDKPLDSDFDFFFKDEAQLTQFKEWMEFNGGKVVSSNDMNITFVLPEFTCTDDEGTETKIPERKVQAVFISYFGSPQELIEEFDYTICQFAFDGRNLICGDYSLYDLARNKLVPAKITYAVSSIRRMLKYAKQGYTICTGGITEILRQVVNKPDTIDLTIEYID